MSRPPPPAAHVEPAEPRDHRDDDAAGVELVRRIEAFVLASTPFGASERLATSLAPTERSADSTSAPRPEAFDVLALATLRFQAQRVEPFRRLLRARGCDVQRIDHWTQAPALPTAAFKTTDVGVAAAGVIFRSSGTTRGAERRSVHRQPFPALYRLVVERSFPAACLPDPATRPDMLSLVPPLAAAADSSLSFMVDHVVRRFGGAHSEWVMTPDGLDLRRARRWLERAATAGAPVLVLATSLALDELLRELESAGARLALPARSVVFDTGGFKGRRRETTREELLERVAERLDVAPGRVVREYGMTELTSQAYTLVLAGGDPEVFHAPPWMRVDAVDPSTLEPVPSGETGMLRIFDLGNAGSAAFLLTEDLATIAPDGGFRLVGRAAGAELRGCSLTAEELGAGAGEARAAGAAPR